VLQGNQEYGRVVALQAYILHIGCAYGPAVTCGGSDPRVGMIFLIINYVLDLTPQASIKPNNLVFLILNYSTMKHTLLQLLVVLLDRYVTCGRTNLNYTSSSTRVHF
jgi:hypothetical protein